MGVSIERPGVREIACLLLALSAFVPGCCGLRSTRFHDTGTPCLPVPVAAQQPAVPDETEPLIRESGAAAGADLQCHGICGHDACPPLLPQDWPGMLRGCSPLRCLRPLFCRTKGGFCRAKGDCGATEPELFAPHSRYHPVPTSPVFEPREAFLMVRPMTQEEGLDPEPLLLDSVSRSTAGGPASDGPNELRILPASK